MPSVIGKPSLLALTSIAWSGKDRPSAETNSPDWRSSLLRPIINAMCAWRSFWAHWGTPWPARIVFIIKMYFIFLVLLPFHVALLSAPSQICRNARGILGIPSLGLRLLISREPPDFNRHVRRCSSGPRRRRNPARYRISAFGSGHVNDPVAQQ